VLVGAGNPLPTAHRPLPFSRNELEEVARLFDAPHPLYEGEATKAALIQVLAGATYVHLSCHGAFNSDDALDSRLLLAHDETLSLRDLLYGEAKDLLGQARLVVLSACQSGVAEFGRLPDEVISLQAGFLQAGARGVVGTLWAVEEVSTSLLMARFYEYHLVGDIGGKEPPMAPAKALACAQNWLRTVTARELQNHYWRRMELQRVQRPAAQPRTSASVSLQAFIRFSLEKPGSQPFFDPYYWAPFVFYGR
jgi:CHAT domain-containing protein